MLSFPQLCTSSVALLRHIVHLSQLLYSWCSDVLIFHNYTHYMSEWSRNLELYHIFTSLYERPWQLTVILWMLSMFSSDHLKLKAGRWAPLSFHLQPPFYDISTSIGRNKRPRKLRNGVICLFFMSTLNENTYNLEVATIISLG